MKTNIVIITFCLLSSLAAYGGEDFGSNDTSESQRCLDNLTFFCLYGDLDYEILQESLLNLKETTKAEVFYSDANKSSASQKLISLSLLFLFPEGISNFQYRSLTFPFTRLKPYGLPYESGEVQDSKGVSYTLLKNKASQMILQEYFLEIPKPPVDLTLSHYPFHQPRFEGFGIRLRM